MSYAFQEIRGGVCAPKGFRAAGVSAHIRKPKKDIALIVSDTPASVAAVFTTNRAAAAPIAVCKAQLQKNQMCSAIVANSGNANACTGERGLSDAWRMVRETATALNLPQESVLVASTGVIGQFLPMDRISDGIRRAALQLAASPEASRDAAEAIMTTDTCPKEFAVSFTLGEKNVHIGAIAKGSGMISPKMATMLAFITTDIAMSPSLLQHALFEANTRSFNRISVDGDCSTNDAVFILANALAENPRIEQADSKEYHIFFAALQEVMTHLAKMIVRDGEGATKLIEIHISGAHSESEAEQAARSVANSLLVKTALHGADANWGRIMAAIGYSGIAFNPEKVSISFDDVAVLKPNFRIELDEARAKEVLSKPEITLHIDLGQGKSEVRFWTCDLSARYVEINGSYRS
ncbi:MAG: bifunctional glutamate N-acetyltransferase/amino-acid acetyltransferase ArgJ [Chloroherpetonaceae bacterium]|nr:bifunctional glutamate N-acetyltransferase/amino-acid acetyltransferase ArgJ [Chloroherpetonaceae bacterium]MCS7211585.1 bifunctional glutamate N-acetyltransferase/amino-acid acetyltransferase ArgJ [Chloroherpetonaceae bacterium]MDW8019099.1 bifunctional glutamate N-acetyltransferase/amino-acid acetyltransferase ArgJ [Chloroherpetonaceae bacterium]